MKIRPLPLVLLSCALVLGGSVLSGSLLAAASAEDPPPPPPAPVKIMFTGDSITQGFDGDYTWRYRLVSEFARQQVDVDFVGPKKFTYGGSNHYLVPTTGATAWDSDHDALGGTRLVDQVPRIKSDVAKFLPSTDPHDVLVSSLGTTDLIHGDTVTGVIAKWHTYIANARASNPNLTFVLGEVMTVRVPSATRTALNAAVRTMAGQLSTIASPIRVYDMERSGWSGKADTYDGTHPTPTGETMIAQRIGWALNGLGVLPGAPQIWHGSIPWPPTFSPLIKFDKHGRLVVNWRYTKRRNEAQFMRLRLTNVRSGRSQPTAWTRSLRLVRDLAPGTYKISVRGMRGTMASVWGAPITVRVPRH